MIKELHVDETINRQPTQIAILPRDRHTSDILFEHNNDKSTDA